MISSIVLNLPSENLIDWLISSFGKFIADKTWEEAIEPELHAEPVEQAIPSKSKFKIKLSMEILGKKILDKLKILGDCEQ